jgi:hypothetical protein
MHGDFVGKKTKAMEHAPFMLRLQLSMELEG